MSAMGDLVVIIFALLQFVNAFARVFQSLIVLGDPALFFELRLDLFAHLFNRFDALIQAAHFFIIALVLALFNLFLGNMAGCRSIQLGQRLKPLLMVFLAGVDDIEFYHLVVFLLQLAIVAAVAGSR